MKRILPAIICAFGLYSGPSHGLVDYTEASVAPSAPPAPMAMKSTSQASSNIKQNSGGSSGMFEVALSYEALSVRTNNEQGDAALMKIDTHFQTPYSFFLDLSYWRLNSVSSDLKNQTTAENGNPEAKLGFNWLQFGKGHDAATVDLYGAYSFKSSNGVGTSRDDKMVGIETAKRFYDFAFAIGYEYQLSGTPSDATELEIGNVQTIAASLGWMVSHDIQFVVEGANIKVKEAGEDAGFGLTEAFSYSYVSPAVRLGITPSVGLELGALFRTQKPQSDEDLLSARLWSLKGVYGNSLHAALRIDI